MQFLHQWIIQKVDPAEFMIDCSCAANYAHPKQLQDTTGCFCLLLFQEKKKKQISQKENPSHSTAPRSDRSVACHVFWCQWSVPGFKFHSFQHQSEVQLHVVSQQNVVFLPTLLRVEAASLGLQNRYLRLCMYIMYIQLLHKGHI